MPGGPSNPISFQPIYGGPSYSIRDVFVNVADEEFKLHSNGNVWKYTGTPFTGWQQLDNNPATMDIVASPSGWGTDRYATGSVLHQLHTSGRIWKYTGTACNGDSCPGWQMLDNNGATLAIAAGGNDLYQLHNTGKIWKSTGAACTGDSCPGWQMLDNNGATGRIAASEAHLYQIHEVRSAPTRTRTCYDCR